jgi:hypothetical protein
VIIDLAGKEVNFLHFILEIMTNSAFCMYVFVLPCDVLYEYMYSIGLQRRTKRKYILLFSVILLLDNKKT